MSVAQERQDQIVAEFAEMASWEDRYKHLINMGKALPKLPEELYQEKFLVKGCQSQVWLHAHLGDDGQVVLQADSDAMIVKGLVALLLKVYSGLKPEEITNTPPQFIEKLGFTEYLSPSRANGFLAMVKQIILYATAFQMGRT